MLETNRLQIMYEKKPCYDIVFETSFAQLWNELEQLGAADKKLCIITDSNVESIYASEISNLLQGKCKKVSVFSFKAGEENKTLDTVKSAYEFLIQEDPHHE